MGLAPAVHEWGPDRVATGPVGAVSIGLRSACGDPAT